MNTLRHHPQARSPRRVRGSALLVVLIISILLLVATLGLWTANEAQESQMLVNVTRVQAEYLARGGHQLALLKARILAQPIYDASDYSVGKNPFYPHGFGYGHLDTSRSVNQNLTTTQAFATGPAFFTGTGSRVDDPPDNTNILDANFDGSPGTATDLRIMNLYLSRFRADLADRDVTTRVLATPKPEDQLLFGEVNPPQASFTWGTATLEVPWSPQTAIGVSSTTNDPAFGAPDPYDGSFEIVDLRVLGGRDNQIHQEEALLIRARGRVQILQKGQMEQWEASLQRVYKMWRCQVPPCS